jgi:hypothetical protein
MLDVLVSRRQLIVRKFDTRNWSLRTENRCLCTHVTGIDHKEWLAALDDFRNWLIQEAA